ncbi:MAG TPA: glycosyltransferase family 25 protein [Pseudolabrys sp.]|nr:glycosyltransferase family 25 protein [Pseudolabrys sp.]
MKSDFDNLFDCFVISLKRTPDRLDLFRARNSGCEVDFRHFEAVDGQQVDLAEVGDRLVAKGTTYKPGSIGAALSHSALWKMCARQEKYYLILEDDAVARNDIKERLLELLFPRGEFDLVILGCNTDCPLELEIAPGIIYGGGFSVRHPTEKHLSDFIVSTNPVGLHRLTASIGTPGYVISPQGARLLLGKCFPMDHSLVNFASWNVAFRSQNLDGMMAAQFSKIAAYACVAPLVLTPNDHGASQTRNK